MFTVDENIKNYDREYKNGNDHAYPNIDLVRLESFFLNKVRKGKLLDFGFGTGQNLKFFGNLGYEINGVETSKHAINLTKNRLKDSNLDKYWDNLFFLEKNNESLPFDDEFFDFIVCSSVLSLVGPKKNILNLLDEFFRILKKNGKMIIDINGPDSGFAKKDAYVIEGGLKTFCPKDIQSFTKFFTKFKIIEIGKTSFQYFNTYNQEFIACVQKE